MDERFKEPYSNPRWWWAGDYIPYCFDCAHFRGAVKGKIVCAAFPDGIPPELCDKGRLHDGPYPGDNGIYFEEYKEESQKQIKQFAAIDDAIEYWYILVLSRGKVIVRGKSIAEK